MKTKYTSLVIILFFLFCSRGTLIFAQNGETTTLDLNFSCNYIQGSLLEYDETGGLLPYRFDDGEDAFCLQEGSYLRAYRGDGTSFPEDTTWEGVLESNGSIVQLTHDNILSNPVLLKATGEENGITFEVEITIELEVVTFREDESDMFGFDAPPTYLYYDYPPDDLPSYDSRPWKSLKVGQSTGVVNLTTHLGNIYTELSLSSPLENINSGIEYFSLAPFQPLSSNEDIELNYLIDEPQNSYIEVENSNGDVNECSPTTLNLSFYEEIERTTHVIIVHLEDENGDLLNQNDAATEFYDNNDFSNYLDDIYHQAIFQWETMHMGSITVNYDLDGDGLLETDVNTTEHPAGITDEMMQIWNNCDICIEENVMYMFLVEGVSESDFYGRWNSFDFPFGLVSASSAGSSQYLNHIIGHELGHSLGLLHPSQNWSQYSAFHFCTDRENIMSIPIDNSLSCENEVGSKLRKYQWEQIHD